MNEEKIKELIKVTKVLFIVAAWMIVLTYIVVTINRERTQQHINIDSFKKDEILICLDEVNNKKETDELDVSLVIVTNNRWVVNNQYFIENDTNKKISVNSCTKIN